MIASSHPEFFVQSCDRVVLDLTVSLIRLFRRFRQPEAQDFFGLWLDFGKLHTHTHERVRVDATVAGASNECVSVNILKCTSVPSGNGIAAVQTQVADTRFHPSAGILFQEFRRGDKGISRLAPLLLFHDSSPLKAGAYSIPNWPRRGSKTQSKGNNDRARAARHRRAFLPRVSGFRRPARPDSLFSTTL
jgi:hypothetical protein